MEIPTDLAVEVFRFVERAARSRGFRSPPAELRREVEPLVREWLESAGKEGPLDAIDLVQVVSACERLAVYVAVFFVAEREG